MQLINKDGEEEQPQQINRVHNRLTMESTFKPFKTEEAHLFSVVSYKMEVT